MHASSIARITILCSLLALSAAYGGERAVAEVRSADGSNVLGQVIFTLEGNLVHVQADLAGLAPGLHGFHIHEHGDCSDLAHSTHGGHFNPTKDKHGSPDSATRHVGDLGNLVADETGHARYDRYDQRISFSGENNIVGRSVIIHEKMDDMTSQPSGNGGTPIACGAIEKAD